MSYANKAAQIKDLEKQIERLKSAIEIERQRERWIIAILTAAGEVFRGEGAVNFVNPWDARKFETREAAFKAAREIDTSFVRRIYQVRLDMTADAVEICQ